MYFNTAAFGRHTKPMLAFFKNLFNAPLARDLAAKRVLEYQRRLLEAESASAYHAKMAEYYREGIVRLRAVK